ncbi:MAG: hypothetical protein J0I46_02790, partial [Thiobacillus sp.]|nr:hypothetical protein [Thiobacillus sp.]
PRLPAGQVGGVARPTTTTIFDITLIVIFTFAVIQGHVQLHQYCSPDFFEDPTPRRAAERHQQAPTALEHRWLQV